MSSKFQTQTNIKLLWDLKGVLDNGSRGLSAAPRIINMAGFRRVGPLLGLIFAVLCSISAGDDDFTEELLLKPLESGHLYGHFQFTTTWNADPTIKSSCKFSKILKCPGPVQGKSSKFNDMMSLTLWFIGKVKQCWHCKKIWNAEKWNVEVWKCVT